MSKAKKPTQVKKAKAPEAPEVLREAPQRPAYNFIYPNYDGPNAEQCLRYFEGLNPNRR